MASWRCAYKQLLTALISTFCLLLLPALYWKESLPTFQLVTHRAGLYSPTHQRPKWQHIVDTWATDAGRFHVDEQDVTFSIQMLTYNRTDVLRQVLAHYASFKLVDRLVVQWNNVGKPPPPSLLTFINASSWRSKVFLEVQSENRLTNRLHLSDRVRTACVLMIDDDLLIPHQHLTTAFRVWRANPGNLVGFTPRAHTRNNVTGKYEYVSHPLTNGSYSMVLTNAAFLHRSHYTLFSTVIPRELYTLIDTLTNCEDIIINVFVTLINARHTTGGILVRPDQGSPIKSVTSSGHRGLWLMKGHFEKRSYCVNKMLTDYGDHALLYSNKVVKSGS